MAHSPKSVLFLRFPGINKSVEKELDDVEGRIRSWCLGGLKDLYELEEDLQLSHEPIGPQNIPQIEVLRVKGFLESAQEIASQIHELSKSLGDIEIRIDVNSGRKEDVANLVKHASEVLEDVDFTIWYTDVGTGHSVEIGSKRSETGRPPIDPLTRIWLGGYPIIWLDSVIDVNSAKGRVLSAYLDSVENALDEEGEDGRILVNEFLAKEGISINRENFLHDQKDNTISEFTVPEDVLDKGTGFWLEKLSGLAIAEAWDLDTVYVGVGIGSNKKKVRIKNGVAKLWRDKKTREELVGLLGSYTIPDEFLNIIKDPDQFAKWIKREYEKLPPSFRNGFLEHSKYRDLDVFAQNQKEAVFIECKLSRGKNKGDEVVKKSQLDSLLLSIGSHRHQLSILVDKADREVSRTSDYDFVAPWYLLRRPNELLQSVIGKEVADTRQGIWIPPDWTESKEKREELRQRDEENKEELRQRDEENKEELRQRAKEKREELRARTKEIVEERGWEGWTPTRGEVPPPFIGDAPMWHHFYCPDCSKTFVGKEHLRNHLKETSHVCYKCDQCEKILHNEVEVVNHKDETGHEKIGGISYNLHNLRIPLSKEVKELQEREVKELQERLVNDGFYQRAIEEEWSSGAFGRQLKKEAGIDWRTLFDMHNRRRKKLVNFFNSMEKGLVKFVQDDTEGWYASDPGPGNEEE
jgi:hypothetical protein